MCEQVGGPRYVPRAVNKAAFRVLDALFPMGAFSRRAVSLLFRLWLHPGALLYPSFIYHGHYGHEVLRRAISRLCSSLSLAQLFFYGTALQESGPGQLLLLLVPPGECSRDG